MGFVMAEINPNAAQSPAAIANAGAPISTCHMKELLEDVPLHSPRTVLMLFDQPEYGSLSVPKEIRVHCGHQLCEGVRRHWKHNDGKFQLNDTIFYYQLVYACSNCNSHVKVFTLKAERQ